MRDSPDINHKPPFPAFNNQAPRFGEAHIAPLGRPCRPEVDTSVIQPPPDREQDIPAVASPEAEDTKQHIDADNQRAGTTAPKELGREFVEPRSPTLTSPAAQVPQESPAIQKDESGDDPNATSAKPPAVDGLEWGPQTISQQDLPKTSPRTVLATGEAALKLPAPEPDEGHDNDQAGARAAEEQPHVDPAPEDSEPPHEAGGGGGPIEPPTDISGGDVGDNPEYGDDANNHERQISGADQGPSEYGGPEQNVSLPQPEDDEGWSWRSAEPREETNPAPDVSAAADGAEEGNEHTPEHGERPSRLAWAPGEVPKALRETVGLLGSHVDIDEVFTRNPRTSRIVVDLVSGKTEKEISEALTHELGRPFPISEVSRSASRAIEQLRTWAAESDNITDEVLSRIPEPTGRLLGQEKDPGSIGFRMQQGRETLGLTQQEMAAELGVSLAAYGRYERDEAPNIPPGRIHMPVLNKLHDNGIITSETYEQLKTEYMERRTAGQVHDAVTRYSNQMENEGVDFRSMLTERQVTILDMALDGTSSNDIARHLGVQSSNIGKQLNLIINRWRAEIEPDKLPEGLTPVSSHPPAYYQEQTGIESAGQALADRVTELGLDARWLSGELGIAEAAIKDVLSGKRHPNSTSVFTPILDRVRERETERGTPTDPEKDEMLLDWYKGERAAAQRIAEAKRRATRAARRQQES